ncbi:MAG: hypothetical protein F4Y28_15910 [Acidimicrobiia bacterium]|nr:hypothetical protein [Acidimicrobiia bacterium]MYG59603.1 hypothetical protein [Acidimicrobiia bacterium]MYJ31017.1 hypothetical protein [Acidimicrobiia bacterium]
MDDMWILAIVLSAEAFVFILVMLYWTWERSKEQKELELKKFIAQSLEDWPIEQALSDWLETATSEGRARFILNDWLKAEISEGLTKYTLDDWLKVALTNWQVRDLLRKQIREVVEVEVRRQLQDANLKAA